MEGTWCFKWKMVRLINSMRVSELARVSVPVQCSEDKSGEQRDSFTNFVKNVN
jgi:hypothetical protein